MPYKDNHHNRLTIQQFQATHLAEVCVLNTSTEHALFERVAITSHVLHQLVLVYCISGWLVVLRGLEHGALQEKTQKHSS